MDEAKQILIFNRQRIYKVTHLKNKYPNLRRALTPEVTDFLLDTIAFWMSRARSLNTVHDKKHPTFFLGTQKGTVVVRHRSTTSVTNRYLNYLCALGLLPKNHQEIKHFSHRRVLGRNITKINANFLKYKTQTYSDKFVNLRPINSFFVIRYSADFLAVCEERANLLLREHITPGNFSYNMLAINGLEALAVDVYGKRRTNSVEKKRRQFIILSECMNSLVESKGYTTKAEICDNINKNLPEYEDVITSNDVAKLFRLFKKQIEREWIHKQPSAAERQQYGYTGNRWIFKRR